MTLSNLIFLVLIFGLPIAVSTCLFTNEPVGRPFFATYMLAVIGSSFLFAIAAFVLMIAGIGGLGPFGGIFALIVAVPIALIIGVLVRRRRFGETL